MHSLLVSCPNWFLVQIRPVLLNCHLLFFYCVARKSMVAYAMSSLPKPPRDVRRQQAKYGTGSGTLESTARAAAIMKHENNMKPVRISSSSAGSSSSSRNSPAGTCQSYVSQLFFTQGSSLSQVSVKCLWNFHLDFGGLLEISMSV